MFESAERGHKIDKTTYAKEEPPPDEGALTLKIWMHLSKDQQKKRCNSISK